MTKQRAHQLLDRLDSEQLAAVVHLLEVMTISAGLPMDDEPFTETERKAVKEADEWLQHNEPISHESVLSELGLTMTDWEKMCDEPVPEQNPNRNG